MEINSNSYSSFDEKYKDIDMSSIENDSQSYDRKLLEVIEDFDQKIATEQDMTLRESDVANNNDDEILRRTKLAQIANDFNNHIEKINNEYEKKLEELKDKYEKKKTYPFYYKWTFIGHSDEYPRLLNGLTYYVKHISKDTIQVYYDVKFSTFLGEYKYDYTVWRYVLGVYENDYDVRKCI